VRTSFCGKGDDTMPSTRYDASAKAKAIRLVHEHAGHNPLRSLSPLHSPVVFDDHGAEYPPALHAASSGTTTGSS
jgi:hypothetical protein